MMLQSRPVISNAAGAPSSATAEVVVPRNHVPPPNILDVAFQFDTQRSVVPKTVDATVDGAGLKKEPSSLAERHDFFHLFWHLNFPDRVQFLSERVRKSCCCRRV